MHTFYPLLALALILPFGALAAGPPCSIGMVVRAGALNYDAKILAIEPSTGFYKVQFVTGYKGTIEYLPPRDLKTCTAPELPPVAMPWFHGVWQLSTGGGGAWAKNPSTGSWKVIGLDVAGAPPIRINPDGNYEWIIDSATTIRGHWRLAAQNERKYGYEKLGTVILLENGESGKNWLVSRKLISSEDNRDRILIERADLGLTYWGKRVGAASAGSLVAPQTAPPTVTAAPARATQAAPGSLTYANVAITYDPSAWTSSPNPNGFQFVSRDQKAFAILRTDAAQHSADAMAESSLQKMQAGDPTLRVTARARRILNRNDSVVVRMDATVSGIRYAYWIIFQGNERGGVQLAMFAKPEDYAAREGSFSTLASGLHLR